MDKLTAFNILRPIDQDKLIDEQDRACYGQCAHCFRAGSLKIRVNTWQTEDGTVYVTESDPLCWHCFDQ